MDFVAEILIEILGEAIMEGGEAAASSRRLPGWLRILILIVLALFHAAVFAVILLAGTGTLRDLLWMSVLLFALDAVWVFLGVRKFRKILRTFSRI